MNLRGKEDRSSNDDQGDRQDAAQREAQYGVGAVEIEVADLPAILYRTGGIEVDLIRDERGTDYADHEVGV